MSDTNFFSPPSTTPISHIAPVVSPGVTPASTAKLVEVLDDNHKKFDIFFNERGFHNHVTHHALAIWSLGASSEAIEAAYKDDQDILTPLPKASVVITEENWKDHLGNMKLFSAYTAFFKHAVDEIGAQAAVEKYVFSKEANIDPANKSHPRMLDRFMAALYHSIIHVGYGIEFGVPGMVIEGLAMTALHSSEHTFVQPSLWSTESITEKVNGLSLEDSKTNHVFEILGKVYKDSTFDNNVLPLIRDTFRSVLQKHGSVIAKYGAQWKLDLSTPGEVDRKIEELQWMNSVVYGIGGWKKDEPFFADFAVMHMVTSSLFLPSVAAVISKESQRRLLYVYLCYSLSWAIVRGRPPLDITGFYNSDTLPPKESSHPTYWSLLPKESTFKDPWNSIIEMSIHVPDEHLAKLQRALAHYNRLYGTRKAGTFSGLPGAEMLDGTLFVRAASLTAEHARHVREARGFWSQQARERGIPLENGRVELF